MCCECGYAQSSVIGGDIYGTDNIGFNTYSFHTTYHKKITAPRSKVAVIFINNKL